MRFSQILLILTLSIGLALVGCHQTGQKKWPIGVAGALKQIMHQGQIEGRVSLDTVLNRPNVYGLGALADLKGELVILDGQPWTSVVVADSLKTQMDSNARATLLVYTHVSQWDTLVWEPSIQDEASLEHALPKLASQHGLDTTHAFPFRLYGEVEEIAWHVIDWPDGDSIHSHAKHKQQSLRGNISETEVEILGFFSRHHQGIFTHHSTFLHLHLLDADRTLAAHIDTWQGGKKMQLLLPHP